jgi:hypothetical protein
MVFPVKVPYTVSADISKFDGVVFNPEPDLHYLHEKQVELSRFKQDILTAAEQAGSLVKRMADYANKPQTEDIGELAMHFEEDLAILQNGILKAICFCFPSGFKPAEKLGLNFFDMHIPVGDGERLRGASEKVTALISREGACFRRYVWTITSLQGLSQHPDLDRPVPELVSDLWFRTETQTTIGLSDGVCLFFVKVNMYPLAEVFLEPVKKAAILESLTSMSDAVTNYKNLQLIRKLLLHQSR